MPTYSYTATSAEGEKISGTEIAKTERDLAHVLRRKGYVLTHVENADAKKDVSFLKKGIKSPFGVPLGEKLAFARNLKVMISAGVALPKALDILSQQTKSKKLQEALFDMRDLVIKGHTMSDAIAGHNDIFSELFHNMIKAGEESGTLEDVLSQLTLQMERDYEVRSKIRGAMLYPSIILFAMMAIGTFMLIFVVPSLASTFRDLGIDLPLTTRVIIALGDFFSQRWYVVLFLAFATAIGLYRGIKTTRGKRIFDAILLRLHVFSGIVRKMNAALTARTLSSLLAAGVPIVHSLEITARVLGNSYFREALEVSAQELQKGVKLSEVLGRYENLYPIMIVQMIQVGEETGETTEVLSKVAEFFEEEISNITKNLTSIIEPILMLFIGVLVGFFAISMFQPMYSMLGSIQ